MDPQAPTGVRRRGSRRWLRRLLILVVIFPPAAFGLSNLALGSPWARTWLAHKIQLRTTLETSIEGASWSPWNGVTFRGVILQQPEPLRNLVDEPLVRIAELRMKPVWKSLLGKEPDVRNISLVSPRVVLPLEIISHLARPTAPLVAMTQHAAETVGSIPTPPSGDLLVDRFPEENISTPFPAESAPPSSTAASAPRETSTAESTPTPAPAPIPTPPPAASVARSDAVPAPSAALPATPQAATPAPPSASNEQAHPVPGPSMPTDFIQVENASFSLVLASTKTKVLEASAVTGQIPVAGDAGKSTLTFGTVRSLCGPLLENTTLHLDWASPLITIIPFEEKLGGFKTTASGQLAMVPGIPIALQVAMPAQPVDSMGLPGHAMLKTPAAAADFRFRGQLLFPSTWEASFAASAEKPSVTANGQETKFDEARSLTILRGGALTCVDARIVGDHLSMLGNASILPTGSTAGVLRIIAPPETTMAIVNQFFPGLQAPPAFSSMSTPQRVALDIEASGSLGDIQIRLGKNGPLAGQPKPPAPATPP